MYPVIRRFNHFNDITRDFQNLFNRQFVMPDLSEEENRNLSMWAPKANVIEKKDEIQISLDLPGMEEKDIHVSVENNILAISGERKSEKEEKEEDYHRAECCYGTFNRSFTLPRTVDTAKINANYKNGVLQLTLPKKEESKPKKIEIKLG